jgi:hypothetical protein
MPKITSIPVETGYRNLPTDIYKVDVLPLDTRDRGLTPIISTNGDMQIPLPNRSVITINVDGTAHMHDNEELPILSFDSIKTGTLHASQTLTVGDEDGWRVEISGVSATYPMRYWDGTTTKFSLDKNGNVVISGSIIAGEIHIPDEDTTANSFHVKSTGNTWWGCTSTAWAGDHSSAAAYVLNTGEARFKNVTLEENVIISGIKAGSEIAIQGWTSTLQFISDGYRKVKWSIGSDEVIRLLDGTEYTIVAGNTGDMTDYKFIYLAPSISTTVLQTSDTYSDAVGPDRILIAIAYPNSDTTSEAPFQVYGGMGGNQILVDNISANSAYVGEIITNSAQIKNALIGDAHISGKLTVGVTDADVTADNPQNLAWITDAGALAYEDMVDLALLDETIIVGGLIKTSLLTANNIVTGTLNASLVTVTNLTGSSITSLNISSKTLTADTGTIGGWVLGSTTIKSAASGSTYIELDQSVPHIKMQGSTVGDVIQMHVSAGAPILESYKAGTLRMRLDEESLKFYDSGGTLRSTLEGGTTGSGTYGLVGTNSLYIPTNITSQKFTIGTNATSHATISYVLGDIYFSSTNTFYFGNRVMVFGDIDPSVRNSNDLGSSGEAWKDLHLQGGLHMYNSSSTTQRVLHISSSNTANLYCDKHFVPVGGGASCTLSVGTDGEYWGNMYSNAYTEHSPKFLTGVGLNIINNIKENPKTKKIDSRKGKLPEELHGPDGKGFELGNALMVCFDAIKEIDKRIKILEKKLL